MMSSNQEASGIDQIIERAVEQNPQSKDILQAFQPVIAGQRHLAQSCAFVKLDCSSIDKEKLKAGVPVSRQISLFSPEEQLKEIALALISAIKEGMPSLVEGLDQMSDLIRKDKLNLNDYFQTYPDRENKVVNHWVEIFQISPGPAIFLMSLMARVVLESKAKEIAAYLGEFAWNKGYCPVCGSFPSVALIQEQGGKRWLHCSDCGYDWRFTRVICPYCDNEAQQGMTYFFIEKKEQESAFICEKCRKYLVTLNRAGDLHERDMDISAISLMHLDMIMQDKGYSPMTSCIWNTLA